MVFFTTLALLFALLLVVATAQNEPSTEPVWRLCDNDSNNCWLNGTAVEAALPQCYKAADNKIAQQAYDYTWQCWNETSIVANDTACTDPKPADYDFTANACPTALVGVASADVTWKCKNTSGAWVACAAKDFCDQSTCPTTLPQTIKPTNAQYPKCGGALDLTDAVDLPYSFMSCQTDTIVCNANTCDGWTWQFALNGTVTREQNIKDAEVREKLETTLKGFHKNLNAMIEEMSLKLEPADDFSEEPVKLSA